MSADNNFDTSQATRNFLNSTFNNRNFSALPPITSNFGYPVGFYMTGEGSPVGAAPSNYAVQDLILQLAPGLGQLYRQFVTTPPIYHTAAYAEAIGAPYVIPPVQPANATITTLSGTPMTPQPVWLSTLYALPPGEVADKPILPDGSPDTVRKAFNNNAYTFPYYCFDNSGTDAQIVWTDAIQPGSYVMGLGVAYTLATCHLQIFAQSTGGGAMILIGDTVDGVNYTPGPFTSRTSPYSSAILTGTQWFFDSIAAFGQTSWQIVVKQLGMQCDFSTFSWTEMMANVVTAQGAGIRPKGQRWTQTDNYVTGIDLTFDGYIQNVFGNDPQDFVTRLVYVTSTYSATFTTQPGVQGSVTGTRVGP
jgi:hypothetical protein